ncbi:MULTISPECIES: hypothetical protein [unclassified Thioalkalivibrio]|uniref:hypothetical protein n=1 Tax=unclassified Thioalkalivibrio TaxID=2621013 RepID=UPI00036F3DEF|nr:MULTISPECIES: hypothetical protein [unclassified Thioalkalivibrio]
MLWVLGVVVAIVVLDLARRPLRRLLVGLTGGVTRLVCALRRQVLHLRDATQRWHHAHLARLEAERVHVAVHALERRYARLVGHDLAEIPDLRQQVHETLRELEDAYVRDEGRLSAEPGWVSRLEALVSTPVSDSPQGQRLAQDMQETVLRIARLGMEEHRQTARGLLSARRRLEAPLQELTGRLEQVHRRLADLQRQGERLDNGLTRFESRDHPAQRHLPAYAQAGSQWLLGAAGLVLTGVAVVVYQRLFDPALSAQFPGSMETGGMAFPDLVVALLLGGAAVCGWLLAEARGVSRLLPQALMDGSEGVRRALVLVAAVTLAAVALVSGFGGFHLEWVVYRQELLDTLLAGDAAPPATLDLFEQSVGAILGLVIPLIVALAPIWLVSVLQATRVMLGGLVSLLLAVLAGILYLLAVTAAQVRRLVPVAFDLLTFPARVVRERFM